MIAFKNTEEVRKKIAYLLKKGHLKIKNGEYKLTKKGIKICKKIELEIGFAG